MEPGQWLESGLLCCTVWQVNLRLYQKLQLCRNQCCCYSSLDKTTSKRACHVCALWYKLLFIFTLHLTWLLTRQVIWMFEHKGIKYICLGLAVYCCDKHTVTKRNFGRKVVVSFVCLIFILQLIVHQDGKLERKPESRNQRSGGYPRMLLTGWLYMACLASFFILPRTTCPRVTLPTVIWALSCQSLIKKMSLLSECWD